MAKFITLTQLLTNEKTESVYLNDAHIVKFQSDEHHKQRVTQIVHISNTTPGVIYVKETPDEVISKIRLANRAPEITS